VIEKWEVIKKYPSYDVSNYGRIRRRKTGLIRKPIQTKNGYMTVMFVKNKKHCLEYVHRLVAEAFISNPFGFLYVNHKDKNKCNNNADNLEWCTARYNVQYSLAKEVCQYSLDGKLINIFSGVREAERALGVGHGRIDLCARGKGKTAHGYVWRYRYKGGKESLEKARWYLDRLIAEIEKGCG
jgi:hypothetical protein